VASIVTPGDRVGKRQVRSRRAASWVMLEIWM
jgi:hypothetical protein